MLNIKNDFDVFFFELFVRTRTNVMTLKFIRCDHATIVFIIVLFIFENVFYLEKSV